MLTNIINKKDWGDLASDSCEEQEEKRSNEWPIQETH